MSFKGQEYREIFQKDTDIFEENLGGRENACFFCGMIFFRGLFEGPFFWKTFFKRKISEGVENIFLFYFSNKKNKMLPQIIVWKKWSSPKKSDKNKFRQENVMFENITSWQKSSMVFIPCFYSGNKK